MPSYNHTTLMGHLTADPEKRITSAGKPVTTFTVAVNGPKSKDRENDVLFMPCVTFGNTAEASGKYLSKGDPVLVDGRLRLNRWEQGCEKKSRTELVVFLVQFLKAKGKGKDGMEHPESASEIPDGDIPF